MELAVYWLMTNEVTLKQCRRSFRLKDAALGASLAIISQTT